MTASWGDSLKGMATTPSGSPVEAYEIADHVPAQAGDESSTVSGGGDRAAGDHSDFWLYRDRTVALLRRYLIMAVEVGRLPSLLGREFFRTRVTSYHTSTFEDSVIFVHDMERSLEVLDEFDKKLIAMIVLQEYTQEEAGHLLGCGHRTVARYYPEALDRVSEVLLARQILTRFPETKPVCGKSCQEGKDGNYPLTTSRPAKASIRR